MICGAHLSRGGCFKAHICTYTGEKRSNVIPVVLNYHKVTLEESCPYLDGSRDKPYKCDVSSHEVII